MHGLAIVEVKVLDLRTAHHAQILFLAFLVEVPRDEVFNRFLADVGRIARANDTGRRFARPETLDVRLGANLLDYLLHFHRNGVGGDVDVECVLAAFNECQFENLRTPKGGPSEARLQCDLLVDV
jgi:hypothetical protein